MGIAYDKILRMKNTFPGPVLALCKKITASGIRMTAINDNSKPSEKMGRCRVECRQLAPGLRK